MFKLNLSFQHDSLSTRQPPLFPSIFFFFNDTATTEIYTLSLHDALPISTPSAKARRSGVVSTSDSTRRCRRRRMSRSQSTSSRSEEHTSELQSLAYLVCRLLLEKKKQAQSNVKMQAAAS